MRSMRFKMASPSLGSPSGRSLFGDFAMEDTSPDFEKIRSGLFGGPDRDLYVHIGYFMSWFSAVELKITLLLAVVLNYRQLNDFDLLVRGMDARVKCERLRRACKNRINIGPNFENRLRTFEDVSIPLRNKIGHRHLSNPGAGKTVYMMTLSRTAGSAFGMRQVGELPDQMPMLELFEHAYWLHLFSEDLLTATHVTVAQSGTLEIEQPRSPQRLAGRQPTPRKARRAKPGKPSQNT